LKNSSNITVKFKKLSKKAVVPSYAHPTDAGMDLVAVSKTDTDRYVEYGLGFATEIPEGWAGFCFPNSRISKYDLCLANSVGIIDDSYRGEWKLRFKRSLWSTFKFEVAKLTNFFGLKDFDIGWSSNSKTFNVGDVVGQVVFMPVPRVNIVEVDELSDTERGDGGFGSTQNNTTESSEAKTETPVKETKRKPRKKK
jgi:dUTP pyrophosphatase